jgi:hypothetical protein
MPHTARLIAFAAAGSLLVACGSSTSATGDAGSLDGTLGDARSGRDGHPPDMRKLGPSGDASDARGSGACTPGTVCGDGGVCAGGKCCATERACGSACCGDGLLCSFGACVTPGGACFDSTDCTATQYCQYPVSTAAADAGKGRAGDASACVGGTLPKGVCLPAPPTCPAGVSAADAGSCIESCQYHPDAGSFRPVLKYSWGGQITGDTPDDVMMAPIVVPLVDTNCDGKVNSEDIPDIVFTTFSGGAYETNGTLHAIRVKDGAFVEDWTVPPPITIGGAGFAINPAYQIAGGDLDGRPGAETVVCLVTPGAGNTSSAPYAVAAYHPDGKLYWSSVGPFCQMPSIADLDQDGHPEVITESGILNGQTGAVTKFTTAAGVAIPTIGNFAVSDVDGDGILDIVTGEGAYHADGEQFIATGGPNGFVAVGDLDKDGKPEVITTGGPFTISIWHHEASPPAAANFSWVQRYVAATAPSASGVCASVGGGPPTVADFNGDGYPDVALAGSINYAVFNGKKLMTVDGGAPVDGSVPGKPFFLWTYYPTDDCSSASTGSTVFDFTGSGKAEVLYSDQQRLRVFDGPDGGVLWQTCNTTGTLQEYPLVVDVDNDGHADIVVVSNAYAIGDSTIACQDHDGGPKGESGIRVFSDPDLNWVRTRALWNEHPYHVTNVDDDGTIPKKELPNWTQPGLNNFRQNKAPGYEFAAADAIVSLSASCGAPVTLYATVRNIGEAALPAGVLVDFYAGTPPSGKLVGSASTSLALYSAQSETLTFSKVPAADEGAGSFYAWVDPPSAPAHPSWHECDTANNLSAPVSPTKLCSGGPK